MAPETEPRKGGLPWQSARCADTKHASIGAETIKVASRKDSKTGTIKLKKPPPKHSKPGNWRDGSVVEGEIVCDVASWPDFLSN